MKKKSTGSVAAKSRPAPAAKARAKGKQKSARPVLTSPWKIGVLVSLLLLLAGVGVGAYFAVLYRIEFSWIRIARSGISFDSLGFFRQMYPLVATLVLAALVSYFIVASSVRRYERYLDSGQDYRKMISLAESIDDLTNPAQIARLSSYPELQSVLRSYGDQIRDISQDLSRGDASAGYGDLETDVEALLGGADAPGSTLEAKPYAAVLRRIADLRSHHRAQLDELEKRDEADRRAIGAAALTCGRIKEAAGGAGEEIVEIVKSVGELAHAARGLASSAVRSRDAVPSDARSLAGVAGGLETSARKLEEGGRVLQELSEENNGIAIGLALMAARGSIEQHDLATFADRVRVTAERFHKLSGSVAGMAQELLAARYQMKEAPAQGAAASPAAPAAQARLIQTIVEMATAVEERGARLRERMNALAGEALEVRGTLHESPPADDGFAPASHAGAQEAREDAVDAGAAEMNIDHGSTWGGMAGEESEIVEAAGSQPAPEAGEERGEAEQAADAGRDERPDEAADFSNMSSLRNLDGAAAAEPERQEPQRGGEGGWMEMPGHSWRPVTVQDAGAEAVDEAEDVPVAVRESAEEAGPAEAAADDEERIYDLSELGAVEYVEETQAQR